jgi:formamidopyrimidine-DNA glycosylase
VPELPNILVYLRALESRIAGQTLLRVRLANPFLLRSVDPPLDAVVGRPVTALRHVGKRIVWAFPGDLFLVIHLMIAGRLHWKPAGVKIPGKIGLAAFDFASGTVTLTEAGTTRRASLHLARGEAGLQAHDAGGLEVLEADLEAFGSAVRRENHTLKRVLTDPRVLSGIGNAFSDEILHRARLSPVRLSQALTGAEVAALHAATRAVVEDWTERLGREAGEGFPENVTAFHPAMAVHGRYGQPCPACGTPVQRIVHAENETNYCPRCQTGGRLLADRALSRLLRQDWPRTLEAWEERRAAVQGPGDRRPSVGGTRGPGRGRRAGRGGAPSRGEG